MARAAQCAAAIAASPSQDDCPFRQLSKHVNRILGQAAPGVFHHLKDAQLKHIHGQSVYLAHLIGGDRWNEPAAVGSELHHIRPVFMIILPESRTA
jgi:hypothetical protein